MYVFYSTHETSHHFSKDIHIQRVNFANDPRNKSIQSASYRGHYKGRKGTHESFL